MAMLERCDVFIKENDEMTKRDEKIIELTPQVLFAETIEWLIECYNETLEENYLEAVERIQWVCNKLSDRVCLVHLLKIDKAEIRRILRRWPKSCGEESNVDWVIDDIVNRIKNKICGIQYYQRGINPYAFEIVISNENSLLFDLERQVIYLFET